MFKNNLKCFKNIFKIVYTAIKIDCKALRTNQNILKLIWIALRTILKWFKNNLKLG